ncbi:hypothetical protein MMYC01_209965 [Madurella mycetomatis]|uniref:Uncharacterized protein n=1 Tax=Madurella mycetomatis TaxID=100816 RepID=A0A175VR29_9PEZI|nr:hypothetical protein MMYC01_209965 [Madurella mycetomatis]
MAPSRPVLRQTTINSCFRQETHRVSKESPDKSNSNKSASRAKPKPSSGSDRVETDVLLAIKPVHLANIASQQKNHEYRKYCLRDGVTRLWFYETSEGGHVRRTPGTVPEEPFGIGNEDFNRGLKQSKYGYPILQLYELIEPITLDEMKDRLGPGRTDGVALLREGHVEGPLGRR